ncbi:3-oxoacyl-[acyl-carrier-protein] reductase [Heliorestis convoluta]|uniref:3-oxoacyl-[acyl-carrier-protein] reductase n=1 Tax=Heliorestis convoluta TaxID=356322 RepID=A0A5Q2MXX7_9FIRM|nr:3-oxoacyl-[acyl-carrier-protein] reductase [Heliorestis convoluta]QGG46741.1 3-oxoacyl-[acyl-carrier-protein] reductase [Heliorestis convoluta]
MRLNGKVALITGAGRGIGKTTAQLFAQEGAQLVITDLNGAAAQTAQEFTDAGYNTRYFKMNVTEYDRVKEVVDEIKKEFGRIDILVNNAGITQDGWLAKMTPQQWQKVIDVNLTGVFNCTQAVASIMMEQGSGVILSTSSIVGIHGNIGQTNYAATKAGVIGMTKSWAKELGRKGVRVNAVAPGFIVTDMTAKVPEKVLTMMKEKTPIGRLGTPEDVAKAFVFLASDDADFISGVTLSVDGGLVI